MWLNIGTLKAYYYAYSKAYYYAYSKAYYYAYSKKETFFH